MASSSGQPTAARLAHSEGHTVVCYSSDGSSIFTAGGDNAIRRFKGLTDEDPFTVEHHTDRVLGITAKNDKLVTASADHSVAVFSFSSAKKEPQFESMATRFTLPARCLSFNTTGSMLATAGDETDIKVVSMLDSSVKVLRGHSGAVRSLSYDPDGDLLASASSDGSVKIWNVQEERCDKSLSVLPRGASGTLRIDWHPAGKMVAVPTGSRVIVYERDSWDELFAFGGDEGHTKDVCIASWSPNGEYLASVSVGGEIIVWESQKRQSLGRFKHRDGLALSSIAWHPKGNEIAWADIHGKFSVWKEPVPEASQFAAPVGGDAAAAATEASAASLANLFADDDDDDEDVGKKRRRIRKKKAKVAEDDEDDDNSGVVTSVPPELEAAGATGDMSEDDADHRYVDGPGYAPALQQEPFQPSSTPEEELRRIMVWNNVGVITSREEDVSCSLDVEFHNVQKHKPIRMIDHYGFTVGALSETCFVMGAPARTPNGQDERDNPSVLFCRNISHWSTDDTWLVHFPEDEEVEVVAVGGGMTGFVAAATSKQVVRAYSTTGIPKYVFTLDGPIVSMAAKDEQLIVVYHEAATAGGQCLGYALFDVDTWTLVHKDRLPTPGDTTLSWLGFTDHGMPACADSNEVVRVLVSSRGYTWTPVVELKSVAKNSKDNHWIIGVSESDILCVVCKGSQYPKVLPRPITTTVKLHMPLVSLQDTVKMEEAFLRQNINFDQIVKMEELDEGEASDRRIIRQYQNKIDQHLIHCISRAVQSQKPGRALDLATSLNLPSNIDVAIKLAVKAKLPVLADRMMLAKQANIERKSQEYHARRAARAVPAASHASTFDSDEDADSKSQVKRGKGRTVSMRDDAEEADEVPEDKAADTDGDEEVQAIPLNLQRRKPLQTKTNASPVRRQAVKTKVANPFAKTTPVKKPTSGGIGDLGATASPQKSPGEGASAPGFLKLKSASTQSPTKRRKKEKDPNAPKKPMSAFFLWLGANRAQLKADNPGISTADLAKKSGELWKTLDAEAKKEWQDKATAAKEEYATAMKKYQSSKEEEGTVDETPSMEIERASVTV